MTNMQTIKSHDFQAKKMKNQSTGKKLILKKVNRWQKNMKNYPAYKQLILYENCCGAQ